MKAIIRSIQSINRAWFKVSLTLLTSLLFLVFPSCQKDENLFNNNMSPEDMDLISACRFPGDPSVLYYGHKIFKRGFGAPCVKTQIIKNPNFYCYNGNFVLKIKNGFDKRTRVSSAEIRINGILIVSPSDFSKNVSFITKPLSDLTPESILEVKLNGTPGSFIDLWIEGTRIIITPVFEKIGPLCQNSIAPELPLSPTNTSAITGTWNPATISTATVGKTSFTFTPDEGQCASAVTMDIEVTASITSMFKQIGPLLQGSVAPDLPATSNNGITGTWNPETINTTKSGSFTFTFTPTAGLCATTATINIEITNRGSVSDIDENSYNTIMIGDQWWMAENLKTTRYSNGDLIGTTTPATLDISSEIAPKYQWAYIGNENNVNKYGRLYTWFTVTDSRGVCPTGWHVPTDEEWTSLTDYLINNGYGYEGSGIDVAKSLAAKSDWKTDATPGNIGNDLAGNNKSGFSALPGGDRINSGSFEGIGIFAGWWSSSESSNTNAWFRGLFNNLSYIYIGNSNKKYGGAIRCVKD
jgi:uncharacterized protein (TIGR02145 family)